MEALFVAACALFMVGEFIIVYATDAVDPNG